MSNPIEIGFGEENNTCFGALHTAMNKKKAFIKTKLEFIFIRFDNTLYNM